MLPTLSKPLCAFVRLVEISLSKVSDHGEGGSGREVCNLRAVHCFYAILHVALMWVKFLVGVARK